MIQLNLLPDVKLQYIKARRDRRMIMTLSVLISAAAVGLLILLLAVNGLQKKHINDLSEDIASESSQLQKQPDINKILTVQNQLGSLTNLHAGKPAANRLFDYLNSLTPSQVAITNFRIDFTQQTITVTGTADALASVNKYVDTLKFTTYTSDKAADSAKAFSNVVLSSFGIATGDTSGKPAAFTVTFSYDKNIFDVSQDVKLNIPNSTTTRADLDKPSDLFEAAPAKTQQGGR
jgi:Tfp pilus assembly protein PilN